MSNRRSAEAAEYHKLYDTAAWKKLRAAQLLRQPLCEMCLAVGRVEAADTVDHIVPHRGDPDLFHDPDNHQSLSAYCHAVYKQQMERIGYTGLCDDDGYPIDPNHPVNRGYVANPTSRSPRKPG